MRCQGGLAILCNRGRPRHVCPLHALTNPMHLPQLRRHGVRADGVAEARGGGQGQGQQQKEKGEGAGGVLGLWRRDAAASAMLLLPGGMFLR